MMTESRQETAHDDKVAERTDRLKSNSHQVHGSNIGYVSINNIVYSLITVQCPINW